MERALLKRMPRKLDHQNSSPLSTPEVQLGLSSLCFPGARSPGSHASPCGYALNIQPLIARNSGSAKHSTSQEVLIGARGCTQEQNQRKKKRKRSPNQASHSNLSKRALFTRFLAVIGHADDQEEYRNWKLRADKYNTRKAHFIQAIAEGHGGEWLTKDRSKWEAFTLTDGCTDDSSAKSA